MEPKFSELKFEFKDVSEQKSSLFSCELEINEDKFSAPFKSQIKLQCLEIMVNTVLSISVFKADKFFGSLQISFGTLFGENLQGKVDRWFKLKNEQNSKLQLKIFASLNVPDKSLKRVPSYSSSARSKEPEVKCPFLSLEPNDLQTLKSLWETRGNNEKSIKLSFEPDTSSEDLQSFQDLTLAKLQNMSGEQLKRIVKCLCSEVEKLEVISKKLPEMKEEFERKINERREIEKNSQVELERIKEKWMSERLSALELLERRKVLKMELLEKQENFRRLETEFDILQVFQGDLMREKLLLQATKMQFEDCENSKKELKGFLCRSEEKKKDLNERVRKTEAEMKINLMKNHEEIKELQKENHGILENIRKVEEEYKIAQENNQNLKKQVNHLNSKREDPEKLSETLENSRNLLKSQEKSRDSLLFTISAFLKEFETESKSIVSKEKSLITLKSSLSSEYLSLSKSLEQSENEILDMQKSIFDEKAQKTSNEQICCVRADLHSLNNDLLMLKDFYRRSQSQILPDLMEGSSQLLVESEKVLSLAEQLDKMIESIDKKEEEMESLKKNMANEQKRHIVHLPVKGDAVDQALAEYLNSKEVPVKFTRQEGGNYLFGSTKIFIKLENSKILVRVKGGFTNIDEFLELYLPVEIKRNASPVGSAGPVRMNRDRSPDILGKKGQSATDSFSRSPKKQ